MKYEVLYERVKRIGVVAIKASDYPQFISIPVDGYIVPSPNDVHTAIDGDEFDNEVDLVLEDCDDGGYDFILLTTDELENGQSLIYIEPASLFSDKKFAMGYALGVRAECVYSAFDGKMLYPGHEVDDDSL